MTLQSMASEYRGGSRPCAAGSFCVAGALFRAPVVASALLAARRLIWSGSKRPPNRVQRVFNSRTERRQRRAGWATLLLVADETGQPPAPAAGPPEGNEAGLFAPLAVNEETPMDLLIPSPVS